jgi:hypothetical protein
MLARFERCEFRLISIGLSRLRPGATVVFAQCRFPDVLDDPVADAERSRDVFLEDCLVVPYEGNTRSVQRRDLDELFPGWREELGRR